MEQSQLVQEKIQIYLCEKENMLFSNKEDWHEKDCGCNAKLHTETHEGLKLEWSNGSEWGKIHHESLGEVMTYWHKGTPCYYTYTAPVVDSEGYIYCYRFDHDEGYWDEDIVDLGLYNGIDTCKFG
ncbi:hypothetical protein V2H29_21600 [Lysinibacillus fusiformis]|uniref:hypothetical protein n=1 Tax=Lysinibacillus fusiformis TaxID=28031 RepID=UPI002EB4DA7D|nr:hypothetical protein [Lysinibacillus fusiformis]